MSTLMQASKQWATRPDDERFVSLTEMRAHLDDLRHRSREKPAVVKQLEVAAVDPKKKDGDGLVVMGPGGGIVVPTHWAFGQLASRAGAPPDYLRELPANLVAANLNHGLRHSAHADKEIKILASRTDGQPTLRAVTGPDYGRVWNAEMVTALIDRFGDGVTGPFKVPGEFGKDVKVTKANTTLYASDRDMFVFLADEKRRVTVRDRRGGETGSLARGFFVWNSEVGKTSYGAAGFYFDYVCSNRIVWGAEGYFEIRGRHTSKAPDRWLDEIAPLLDALASENPKPMELKIVAAQRAKLPTSKDEDVSPAEGFLKKQHFSKTAINDILLAHVREEGRPIETIWDAVTGVTAYARSIPYQDKRVEIERRAGEILSLA